MKNLAESNTIADILSYGQDYFTAHNLYYGHGFDNPWDEALALLVHVLNIDYRSADKSLLQRHLTSTEKNNILSLWQQRVQQRIPVAYLIQSAYFAGFKFYVDERVLIPRSPIAELIEQQFCPWLSPDKVKLIADLGTGSACIAIAAAYAFPQATVDAVDNNAAALAVARINCAQHKMVDRIHLINSDMFNKLLVRYDVIISNPPYVPLAQVQELPQEYQYEPHGALAAGADGLHYVEAILTTARRYLNTDGILVVEVGDAQMALEQRFPLLPFLWLEFERGGHGVFLLRAEQLPEEN